MGTSLLVKYAMLPLVSAQMKFCEPTSKVGIARWMSNTSRATSKARKVSSSRVPEKPVYCTDSATPVFESNCTIGPWLRRGEISVKAGT